MSYESEAEQALAHNQAIQAGLIREGVPEDIDPGDVISKLRAEAQNLSQRLTAGNEQFKTLQKENESCMKEINRLNSALDLAIREKNKAQDLGVDYKNKFLAECERYNDLIEKILEKMR